MGLIPHPRQHRGTNCRRVKQGFGVLLSTSHQQTRLQGHARHKPTAERAGRHAVSGSVQAAHKQRTRDAGLRLSSRVTHRHMCHRKEPALGRKAPRGRGRRRPPSQGGQHMAGPARTGSPTRPAARPGRPERFSIEVNKHTRAPGPSAAGGKRAGAAARLPPVTVVLNAQANRAEVGIKSMWGELKRHSN